MDLGSDGCMKKPVVCIIIENDGYLVKANGNLRYNKIMPHNIYKIPNIPFYHSAWTYHNQLIKPEISELKEYIRTITNKAHKTNTVNQIPFNTCLIQIPSFIISNRPINTNTIQKYILL